MFVKIAKFCQMYNINLFKICKDTNVILKYYKFNQNLKNVNNICQINLQTLNQTFINKNWTKKLNKLKLSKKFIMIILTIKINVCILKAIETKSSNACVIVRKFGAVLS